MKRMFAVSVPLTLALSGVGLWVTHEERPSATDRLLASAIPAADPTGADMAFVSPLEVYRSDRAVDWLLQSDRVVVLEIVAEEEIPSRAETRDEEGFELSGRRLTAQVLSTVWTPPGATTKDPPPVITTTTSGWLEDEKGRRLAVVSDRSSRLVPGHRYVVGLSKDISDCSTSGVPRNDQWSPFASQAVIPFDQNLLGVGEFEGRSTTEPFGGDKRPPSELFDAVAGRSLEHLRKVLRDAEAKMEAERSVDPKSCEAQRSSP